MAINGGGIKPYAAASMEKAAAFWPKNWFGQWAAVLLLLKIKMRKRQCCFWAMGGVYLISCSKSLKKTVLKNSLRVISKPSHSFLMVTIPGFWLSPFKMLFTVDCGTPVKLANALGVIQFCLHNIRILCATASLVFIESSPLASDI